MSLSAKALCKLGGDSDGNDGLKDEIGLASDSSQDAHLERLIEATSQNIIKYCSVPSFHYESARVDDVKGWGTPLLHVPKRPLLSIGSVVYDPQGSPQTVSSDDYLLDNGNQGRIYRDGGWLWTVSEGSQITTFPLPGTEESLYRVTYECGYKTRNQVDNLGESGSMTLPEEIEDACLILAASRYYRAYRDRTKSSERLGAWSASYSLSASMPPDVAMMLDEYAEARSSL